MKIALHYVEEVDSTLRFADRELASGRLVAPFAVYAGHQNAGRGRQGRSWSSPSGNLHFTLALGSGELTDIPATLIPIKVATIVAWWLAVEYDIRPTLKWPNDLMFGGCKLGGILCEGSGNGPTLSKCQIGIGINLNVVPELAKDMAYDAISLSQIVGIPIDIKNAAESLCRFVGAHWHGTSPDLINDDFNLFAIEPGQLFLKKGEQSQWLKFASVNANGSAQFVSPLDPRTAVELYNPDESMDWIYSSRLRRKFPVIVADVGNTAIKLAVFENADDELPILTYRTVGQVACAEAVHEMEAALASVQGICRPWPIHVSHVNPEGLQILTDAVAGRFEMIEIPHRPLRYRGAYDVTRMGHDRLALIEATLNRRAPDTPAVVVSCGTVTVVDFIDAKGIHIGGWLVAGVQTEANALADYTSKLPQVTVMKSGGADKHCPIAGIDTESAIVAGARHSLTATVNRARSQLARHCGVRIGNVDVYVTGGYSAALAKDGEEFKLIPTLLMEGLRSMVVGGATAVHAIEVPAST